MDRRTALKKTGVLFGSGIMASSSGLLMQSCIEKVKNKTLDTKVLTDQDIAMLDDIIQHLVPDSEVPEEIKLAIPLFIDTTLADYSHSDQVRTFKEGMQKFNTDCETKNGSVFINCTKNQQLDYLKKQESNFVTSNTPTFYGSLKQWTFEAFFQTEYGITNYLLYNPLPGTYSGCVPMKEMGRIQHNNDSFKL